jgi:hypothetical protein
MPTAVQGWWDRLWQPQPPERSYVLTRFAILRLLGLIYLMAFLTWVFQGPALVGSGGLLPASLYLDSVAQAMGSRAAGFLAEPSLFWLADSDAVMFGMGWVGVALSLLVLGGYANALVLLALWALHLSVSAVGQTFYGFGWEMQLAETGFLCVFLCPLLDGRPLPPRPPPVIVIWLLRWLIVRIMVGAGLIKLRGDACWRELTCLDFHFETQPIPSPLSPLFHALPPAAHKVGVLFNHFVELVVPLFALGPPRVRRVAGAGMLALQVVLILSGNLSYLNWLTIVPILACFDDGLWTRLSPGRLRAYVAARLQATTSTPSKGQRVAVGVLAAVVALLSIDPVVNLLSSQQRMNTSFNRLQLVNSYGAFGSVGRERHEIVFEGTMDETLTPGTRWTAYEWKCKPGDPARRPCWMSPYHRRLDWLIWFAAMGQPPQYPWSVHLVWKLLHADGKTLGLLAGDPFAGRPPRFVRANLYRYRLNPPGAGDWWQRQLIGPWLPPLAKDHDELQAYLRERGWLR